MSGRQLSAARGGLAPDAGDAGYCAGGARSVGGAVSRRFLDCGCLIVVIRPGEDYPTSEHGRYGSSAVAGFLSHVLHSRFRKGT